MTNNMNDLPKLYRPVNIRFSSLRNQVGASLGVIFDIDTIVERKAMRVKICGSWKWQIKDINKLIEWDWFAETDQLSLDEIGMDLDAIECV